MPAGESHAFAFHYESGESPSLGAFKNHGARVTKSEHGFSSVAVDEHDFGQRIGEHAGGSLHGNAAACGAGALQERIDERIHSPSAAALFRKIASGGGECCIAQIRQRNKA